MATPQDLLNANANLATLDAVVTSAAETTTDRLGQQKLTLSGFEDRANDAIAATGYFPAAGSFEAGGTITDRNQYLQLITTSGGNVAGAYTWGGPLPKVVSAGNTPASTGGTSPNTWVYRSDATLRSNLSATDSDVSIAGVEAQELVARTKVVASLKQLRRVAGVVQPFESVVSGSGFGGGDAIFYPDMSETLHNGGTVWAAAAVDAWDGTQEDLPTLLDYDGDDDGCYVRQNVMSVTPDMFGSRNDGSFLSDDSLFACGIAAVNLGLTMRLTPLKFATKWTPPHGLSLVSDFSENNKITFTGLGDGIEITGPIFIDGVVIDGNNPDPHYLHGNGYSKTLLGIHGDMTTSGGGYISGVKLGRILIQNSRHVGVNLANIDGLEAESVSVCNVSNAAVILSGVTGLVKSIKTENIGDLQVNGSRRGQGLLLGAETKLVADWYNSANAKPVDNFHIESLITRKTTDSGGYVNDALNRGISGVTFGSIDIELAGKDGFKAISGSIADVTVGKITARKVGNAGCLIRETAGFSCNDIIVDDAGFDVIGEITGTPAPYINTGSASDPSTANRTISSDPGGIQILNCSNVKVTGKVSRIRANPASGAEGHGITCSNVDDLTFDVIANDTDGNGLRFADVNSFNGSIKPTDCAKLRADTDVLFSSASSYGFIDIVSKQNVQRLNYAFNLSGACIDVSFNLVADRNEYVCPSGQIVRGSAAVNLNWVNAPQKSATGVVAFDASALATVTHDLQGLVPLFSAQTVTSGDYIAKITAVTATNATLKLVDSAGVSVPSVSVPVHWNAKKIYASGGF